MQMTTILAQKLQGSMMKETMKTKTKKKKKRFMRVNSSSTVSSISLTRIRMKSMTTKPKNLLGLLTKK